MTGRTRLALETVEDSKSLCVGSFVADYLSGMFTRYLTVSDYPDARYHDIWNAHGGSIWIVDGSAIHDGYRIEDNEVGNISFGDATSIFRMKLLGRHPS